MASQGYSFRPMSASANVSSVTTPNSSPTAQDQELPWLLSAAICVERAPSITPKLSEFQLKMLKNLEEINFEGSLKSDHEVRHEADLERAEKRKTNDGILEAGVRTAVDDEDAWAKEFAAFTPISRQTEADEKNDVRSLRRALHRPLHLIVERKVGSDLFWDLPTVINKGGETMRETAERALASACGTGLSVNVLGNAPWAFYRTTYSRKIRDKTGKRGEKVFIYKAFHDSGDVTMMSAQKDYCNDYKWVLREELWDMLHERPRRALFEILYDEE